MTSSNIDKGGRAEELLRGYFLRKGYFAVRGVKVFFHDVEVTDIDLWLYFRFSTIGRARINVDAKYRTTPKALERIIWAKGLQVGFGFDQCIVATTDKRPIVKECGAEHGVLVLDGSFLSRLAKGNNTPDERLTEEDFTELIVADKLDKLVENWRARLGDAKARLATQLDFDGCNSYLDDARFFAERVIVSDRREGACRLVYLIAAFFLVALDYSSRTFVLEDSESRKKEMLDGFRYGSKGRKRTEEVLGVASGLISSYAPELRSKTDRIKRMVYKDLGDLPVEILAEYFSRKEVSGELFSMALLFERFAYQRSFLPPGQLKPNLQSVIGVLLDFHKIDRTSFFDKWESVDAGSTS